MRIIMRVSRLTFALDFAGPVTEFEPISRQSD
jgi:hypothetical protein